MDSKSITDSFLKFFREDGHVEVDGSSIIPDIGEDLLFTNAGMNQFKDILSGQRLPEQKRVCSVQRCIRAGGKHNDFEDIGKDNYHHTCFDMLGSWSFGDYWVEHAIDLAFEWLTSTCKLDVLRLYVTYFSGNAILPADEMSFRAWSRHLPANHILPFGEEHNIWTMGKTGPVGCCTEIHYDLTGHGDCCDKVNTDNNDVIELWNIVLVTHEILEGGSVRELEMKSIDTGAGLERITAACQSLHSTYATEIFRVNMATQRCLSGDQIAYRDTYDEGCRCDQAMRVIADHTRLLAALFTFGIVPGPKERNFIARKAVRRVLWNAYYVLSLPRGCLGELLVSSNLKMTQEVQSLLDKEENAFIKVYESGRRLVAKCKKPLSGQDTFNLVSTHGIKAELIAQIAAEQTFDVDWVSFNDRCNEHRVISKSN